MNHDKVPTKSADGRLLWRVSHSSDPLGFSRAQRGQDSNLPSGNRFDAPLGDYGVLDLASDRRGAFAETLDVLRPSPRAADYWGDDNSMALGAVPRAWRDDRLIISVELHRTATRPSLSFLDVEEIETRSFLERHLGVDRITVSTIRGDDRRLTRRISEWAYAQTDAVGRPRFAGIRFLSKHDSRWECWAVFDGVEITRQSTAPISSNDPDFSSVCGLFHLTSY